MRKSCGVWVVGFWLVSCSPTLPTYDVLFSGNTIDVPVDNIGTGSYTVVADEKDPFDILLVKDSPGAYHAIYLRCTNDEKPLDPTGSEIVCPVCGSVYNLDGSVKKGPADKELFPFLSELNADQTLVKIDISPLGR